MLAKELIIKTDDLMKILICNSSITNIEAVEQITYFLILYELEKKDNEEIKKHKALNMDYTSIFDKEMKTISNLYDSSCLKWSVFKKYDASKLYENFLENIFPFIKNLSISETQYYGKITKDAIFKVSNPLNLLNIITNLDIIFQIMEESNYNKEISEFFEYLISIYTIDYMNLPCKNIIQLIVRLMEPKLTDVICNPNCQTADFLVQSGKYLNKFNVQTSNYRLYGFNKDKKINLIANTNMYLNGFSNQNISYMDSLSDQNKIADKYTLIFSDISMKENMSKAFISKDLFSICKTTQVDLLFIVLTLRMLKINGSAALIVSNNVLISKSKPNKNIRKLLIENNKLQAIISIKKSLITNKDIPQSIIIYKKTEICETNNVFFGQVDENYNLETIFSDDGLDFESKLKKICIKDSGFFVSKEKLKNVEYILNFNSLSN